MENSIVSLKTEHISSTALTAPANNRYFVFSKQLDRMGLAEGFAQKAPSQIVTALNVTKIAPAIFFMIEKLAAALETVLNAGASLLGCAAGALDDHEIVVVDTSEKAKEMPAAAVDEKPVTPTPVKDETTAVEESVSPVKEETPAAVVDEKPATPIKDETIEETPVAQPQAEAPEEDGLNKYKDLLIEPVVPPPADSNTTRNVLIGAGVAATIGIIGYLASRLFTVDPRTLNPGNGTCPQIPYRTILETFGASQPPCHPNSGKMCSLPKLHLAEELFGTSQSLCHPDSGLTSEAPATCLTITQLLNGNIKEMSEEELLERDRQLTLLAHNKSAYEYDENAERCWVVKKDSANDWWCEQALCKDAPNGSDADACLDPDNYEFRDEEGLPYTAWKKMSNGDCIEVPCGEQFACVNDPACEE